tara:strand:+ start:42 stop:1001 length:960 start_codon:yes stop_codon:yes gene_type:complete
MISQLCPGVLKYWGLHLDPQTIKNNIEKQVTKDLIRCNFTIQDFRNSRVIVDFSAEGHCDKIAEPFVKYLQSIPVQDLLVRYTACVDTTKLDYHAQCFPTFMIAHCDWLNLLQHIPYNRSVEKKFLCLMRRPSLSRSNIKDMLLDAKVDVRLSYSVQQGIGQDSIVIDGSTNRKTGISEHDQRNPLFHSCLFNLVVETGCQLDSDNWQSLFITEKTFKSFGLRQIPIWFAIPGIVNEVRKLGFDLFEDIVNHNYDNIQEENLRFQTVVEQVTQLDQTLTILQCQTLRDSIEDRLNANFDLLVKLEHNTANLIRHHKTFC